MTTLLEKLQSATEGTRELSDECLLAWGWERKIQANVPYWKAPGLDFWTIACPHVTADLQDGVDAVPEGWVWSVSIDYELPGMARLHCTLPAADASPISIATRAATPAIALCIAIEKARNA